MQVPTGSLPVRCADKGLHRWRYTWLPGCGRELAAAAAPHWGRPPRPTQLVHLSSVSGLPLPVLRLRSHRGRRCGPLELSACNSLPLTTVQVRLPTLPPDGVWLPDKGFEGSPCLPQMRKDSASMRVALTS